MALTVLVTRDVEDRYRGFLSSVMLEVAPGVYCSPHLSARARDRVWSVVTDWHRQLGRGSLVLIHDDRASDGGMSVRQLGTPPVTAVKHEGVLFALRG